MSRDLIWSSTPRELHDDLRALRARRQDELNLRIMQAWWSVAIRHDSANKKRLPDVSTYLIDDKPKRQSSDELSRVIMAWAVTHNALWEAQRKS